MVPMLDLCGGESLLRIAQFGRIELSVGTLLGVCLSNLGDAGRCEATGSKKPEAYSLGYVEDFFGPKTRQMPADRLPQKGMTWTDS